MILFFAGAHLYALWGAMGSAQVLWECGNFTLPYWRPAPHRENCISPATACAACPLVRLMKKETA